MIYVFHLKYYILLKEYIITSKNIYILLQEKFCHSKKIIPTNEDQTV